MRPFPLITVVLSVLFIIGDMNQLAFAQNMMLTEQNVLKSIERGRKAMLSRQGNTGAWKSTGTTHIVGETALATLALIYSGMETDAPEIQRAVTYLRDVDVPNMTYEASLMLMVFAAVKDRRDRIRMRQLVANLETGQVRRGNMRGCWSYYTNDAFIDTGGDHSNGQFAVLGLYEAAHVGIPVSRQTWEAAQQHWARTQNGDGGWGYSNEASSSGSMTAAGLAVMVMTSAMLQKEEKLDANGNPVVVVNGQNQPACCQPPEPDDAIERGVRWMANHFAVSRNPSGGGWLYYYLYGLERAGRLSGRRFFGERDWYREGARFLIRSQQLRDGFWNPGGNEANPVIGSSFALLFLSKGLAPVLINKLRYDAAAGQSWNWQPNDIRNLTDRITGAEGWPKLMTWQVLDFVRDPDNLKLSDLNQSPILYLAAGSAPGARPVFSDRQIELLREYVNLGGFILAANNCRNAEFREGIDELIDRLYPNGETSLQRLQADHPVFRAEYLLNGDTIDLWGAEFGCRTAIMYSPDDLPCLWNRWNRYPEARRNDGQKELRAQFLGRVERALNIGTNIVTYATGREPINKLKRAELAAKDEKGFTMRRGLLQIARLRHTGGWDTARKAARNLTLALNQTVGLTASTEPAAVNATAENLYDYSMLVMHGRQRFTMTPDERDRLKSYLDRGRVLFADACCGAPQFDRAFRALCGQLYPSHQLERIPIDDELFQIGHSLDVVRRRHSRTTANNSIAGNIEAGPPFLEGIKVNGRYVIIYSKHDISCALERQASVACAGYVPDDAVRIAVNVVLYAKLKSETVALPR